MSELVVNLTEDVLNVEITEQLTATLTEDVLSAEVTTDGLVVTIADDVLSVTFEGDLAATISEDVTAVSLGEVVEITNNYGGGNTVVGEIPNGTINGSNATFTTDFDFTPESVLVFRNGLAQYNPTHYTTTGTTTIILNFSPIVGDVITVNYTKA